MNATMTSRSARVTLLAISGIFVAIGLAFWFWTPQVNPDPDDAVILAENPAAAPGVPAPVTAEVSGIISANIFSAARTAPARRYNPADYESMDAGSVPEVTPSTPVIQQPAPELFGTVLGGGGAMALMQEDSSGATARLFREGDRIGQYRVIKIKPGSVIVSGPGGRREIQVERNPTGAK